MSQRTLWGPSGVIIMGCGGGLSRGSRQACGSMALRIRHWIGRVWRLTSTGGYRNRLHFSLRVLSGKGCDEVAFVCNGMQDIDSTMLLVIGAHLQGTQCKDKGRYMPSFLFVIDYNTPNLRDFLGALVIFRPPHIRQVSPQQRSEVMAD
jgi:hypothetical protein